MSREARRGGRGARRAERFSTGLRTLPGLQYRIPVYEVLNEEGLGLIHDASCKILEEIGIEHELVPHPHPPPARAQPGHAIDGRQQVHHLAHHGHAIGTPRGEQAIEQAPALHAHPPAVDLAHVVVQLARVVAVAGAPERLQQASQPGLGHRPAW